MGWVVPVSEASSSEVPQTPVELETGSVERPAQKLRSVAPSVGGKGASETSGMESDGKVPASPRKGGLTVGVPYSLRVKHGALESSGFGDTLRFMRYRAFLKWYNGAHERTWSRLAAATYCLVAGGSILFSRDTLCPEEAPTNDFLVVHLAGIFGLCIIFLLLSHPLFVTRWAVRISFLYCILSFVLLLSVALRFRYLFTGSSGDGGTSSDEPPDPVCPFSIIFPYSFYGVIAAIVLWGLLYSLVLNRLAAYYYLKSNIFLDHWYVTRCQVVDVLVPAFGQSDKARYQRLVRRHARTTRDVPRGAADGAANIRGLEFGAVQDPSVHRGRKTSFSVAAAAPQHCPAPADRWAPTEKAVKSCPPFGFDERLRVARGVRLECVAESRGEFTLRRIKTFWRRCWFLFCCKRRALARPLAAPVLSFGLTKESPTDVRKGCTRGRFFRPWGQRHWAHKTDSWDPFAPSRRHRRGRRRITFIGEVDSQGKPQGFGAWKEEGYNFGERLVGFWSRGLPDGPYKSRELGTGSGFMCIRIGWAQYALNVDTLRFGVSNVECSVSGKFYRGFPSVTLLSPPEAPVAPSFVPLLKPFDEKDMKIEESSWVTGTTKNVDFNIPAVQKSFPSVFDQVVADLTEAIPSEDNPTADGRVFEDKSGVQVTESPEDKMAVSDLPKLRESALHGSSMYCLPFPCMSPRYENDVFNAGVSSTNFSSVLNTCAVSHALNSAESQDLVLTPVSHTVAVKPAVLMKMERPSGSSSERSSNTSLDYNSLTHGRDMPHRDATYSTVPAQDRGATDTEVAHISGTRRSRAQKTHLRKVRWRRRNRAQRFRFTHVERKNQYQERHQGGPRFFPRKSQSAVCVSQRDNFAGISMSGPTESQSHGFSTSKNKSSRMGDEESIERSDHQDITGSRKPSLRRTNALKKIGRTAMGVPHQIMAGGAAAAGAGVAALRRLRRRDVETIARIEKCRWCIAWSLAELAPHTPNFGVQPRSELIVSVDQERGISISGYVPNASVQHEAALSFDMGLAFDLFDGERALCPEDEDNSCTPSPLFRHAGSRRSAEILEETGADETQSVGTGDSGSIVIHSLPNDPGHLYHSAFRIGNEPRDLSSLPVVTDKDGGLDFLGLRKIYDTSVVSGNERRVDVEKTKTDDAWTHTPLYQRTIGGGKVVHQTDSHELRIRVIHRRLVGEASVEASEASSTLDHELAGAGVSHPCPYQTASKTRDNEDNKKISSDCTKPQRRWSKLGLVTPELEADGWTSMDAAGTPEVLLYIHGYNNSHIESLQILGQMAAFGNYPNHIRLFLFTWPAGSGFWQFYTARKAAEDPKTHKALTELLEALRDNGIREVHILCHSMGARVFLRSFTKIAHRVFSEVDASCEPGSINMAAGCDRQSANGYSPFLGRRDKGKLQLVTTTLLNPEYFLEDFVMEDYPFLRRFCNHITIFADAKDKALQWSERFSRRPALGKTVFGLWKPLQSSASGATDSFFLNAHSQGLKQPPHYLNTISFFHYNTSDIKLGTDGRNEEDRGIEWLDLDVIDTTFMDQNVHALRHSFWNLNRGIIEDIRELMVTRKRARQRTGRLDRRDGNVWVYRVAPSFLTSIFEVSI